MKRFLLILTVLVMTLCLFAGCASNEDESLNNVTGGLGGNVSTGSTGNDDDTVASTPDNTDDGGDDTTDPGNTEGGDNTQEPSNTTGGDNTTDPGNTDGGDDTDGEEDNTVDYEGEGWIKVASYNVKYLSMDRLLLVENIKKIDADLIGIQELGYMSPTKGGDDHMQYLKDHTDYPYAYFCNCTGDYGHGILSKYPIKESTEGFYNYQNANSAEKRKWNRNVIDVDGTELVWYNTHLCVQDKLPSGEWNWTHGETQFKEVLAMIYKEKGPTMLTADFNLMPERQAGIVDTTKLLPLNGMKDWMFTVKDLGVDNIYIKNMADHYFNENTQCGLEMGAYDGASDHAPIWSWIKIK